MKPMTRHGVADIVARHRNRRGALIAVLDDIQGDSGYLSEDSLRWVADLLKCPLKDVYGVATFYRAFSLTPRGRHRIAVCLGTACHVRGSESVLKAFERHLKVAAGETTADGEITLEKVHCLGACALGPVVAVDQRFLPRATERDVPRIVQEARRGAAPDEIESFTVGPACPACGHTLMDADRRIGETPAIALSGRVNGTTSRVWLSSGLGRGRFESEREMPADETMEYSCPHCGAPLADGSVCPDCDAPMAGLTLGRSGALRLCQNRRCGARTLDIQPVCTCAASVALHSAVPE